MSPESPARCALCHGGHPANYKCCPVYKKLNYRPPRLEHFIISTTKSHTNFPKSALNSNTNRPSYEITFCCDPF
ncbi:unnamed protein product [Macrosiphum euphorbiae]|uniref:Uncharacterized protein n=1 Tax=Macrosiphum euphorbiae TaxID=13131 RepID=A0AAV0WXN1_9HEMI|nr:unnamed protein product [Macrosiphum euphorbiae]